MYEIFISYNWNISSIVDRFYDKLVDDGYIVWRDVRNLNKTNEPLTEQLCLLKINITLK